MRGVLAAVPAVFLEFQTRGRVLFVFLGRIVAALAFVARQRNHEPILFLCHEKPVPCHKLQVTGEFPCDL